MTSPSRLFPRLAAGLFAFSAVAGAGCTPPQTAEKTPPPPAAPPVADPAPPAAPVVPPAFDPNVFVPMSLAAQTARVPVIMYHDIVERRGKGSVYFDCTREEFVAQMDRLAEAGATPITLEQLHRHLTRGEPVPEKSVVLTFDDNYQGFYDHAYPVLKERGYPAAVFVHTNFVGDKSGAHPKMDWDTLRALDKEGLVTVASHTCSHPDDMRLLPPDKQRTELVRAKEILEERLGHKIPYFAYPVGRYDKTTLELSEQAGYTLAFTIANGPAEESPGILQVNRYIHTRLEQALEDSERAALAAPAALVDRAIANRPVRLETGEYAGVELGLVRGGRPSTRRTAGRKSVGEFVKEADGVAGINGTFFADAALRGTSNTLIGPSLTGGESVLVPDEAEWRLPRLLNRPLVMWGPKRLVIAPFQPGQMNAPEPLLAALPDVTDAFLAGAWIVHGGVARTADEMRPYAVRDFDQTRRRAFFGITADGEVVLGASREVVGTAKLAEAAAAAGVDEAVLLDSGFSTSLVFGGKIIVTGHTARHLPSRPVPHAIVLSGTLVKPTDPVAAKLFKAADAAVGDIPAAQAQSRAPRVRRTARRSQR
jgi:peptidoglycan/xylan/chitin deacetylase (PgdA/CDA1 family)